jgi:hypothetical protein
MPEFFEKRAKTSNGKLDFHAKIAIAAQLLHAAGV